MVQEGAVESEDSELAAFLDEGLFGAHEKQPDAADEAVAAAGISQLSETDNTILQAEQQGAPLDQADVTQQAKRQKLQRIATEIVASDNITQPLCPPHPGFCFGMCIRCGAPKPQPVAIPSAYNHSASQPADAAPGMTRIKHLHSKHGALEVCAARTYCGPCHLLLSQPECSCRSAGPPQAVMLTGGPAWQRMILTCQPICTNLS